VRFEVTAYALKPDIKVIAPWREERYRKQFNGRNDMLAYCAAKGIPVQASAKKPYSMDRNLLHISFEGGILEDAWNEPKEDMFVLSVSPADAPNRPAYVEIDFVRGNAVAVNGVKMNPLKIMQTLNKLGGAHGVGRIDMVENRFVGMKSRGVYETPGGTILHRAREGVEQLTMDREVLHLRNSLIPQYAKLVYNGFWFAPEREMLQTAMDEAASSVTGTARVKLYKGTCSLVGRKAPKSLYDPHMASFEGNVAYDQGDATGFIKLNALRLRVRAKNREERMNHGGHRGTQRRLRRLRAPLRPLGFRFMNAFDYTGKAGYCCGRRAGGGVGGAVWDAAVRLQPRPPATAVPRAEGGDGAGQAADLLRGEVQHLNAAVIATLAAEGAGADVVSGGELFRRARRAGVPADQIVFAGVGKTESEIDLRAAGEHPLLHGRVGAGTGTHFRVREKNRRDRPHRDPREPGRGSQDAQVHQHRQEGEQVRGGPRPRLRGLRAGGAAAEPGDHLAAHAPRVAHHDLRSLRGGAGQGGPAVPGS
jgi:argininosuccinate synthase